MKKMVLIVLLIIVFSCQKDFDTRTVSLPIVRFNLYTNYQISIKVRGGGFIRLHDTWYAKPNGDDTITVIVSLDTTHSIFPDTDVKRAAIKNSLSQFIIGAIAYGESELDAGMLCECSIINPDKSDLIRTIVQSSGLRVYSSKQNITIK